MTYRASSDFPLPYGRIGKLKKQSRNALLIDIKSKKKFAFWLVNHLQSQGERDRYVKALQKVVQIDIYGNGRKLSCPEESRNMYGLNCKITLAKDYKFFLAFENSLCQDYVTEKFFDILNLPVVPIVYGRANYSSIAPPHSFIDVRDFKSPRELGKYLLHLNDNEEEYMKYFKWKEDFQVSNLRAVSKDVLCELCHRLNHIQDYQKAAYSDQEMEKWWRGEPPNSSICVSADKIIPGM